MIKIHYNLESKHVSHYNIPNTSFEFTNSFGGVKTLVIDDKLNGVQKPTNSTVTVIHRHATKAELWCAIEVNACGLKGHSRLKKEITRKQRGKNRKSNESY